MRSNANETRRLLRKYDELPKTSHGADRQRHPEIHPEWVMLIIEKPHDQWEVVLPSGEVRTILVGCVPQFSQWIRVVLIGDAGTSASHTAYPDKRLESEYGGRPWEDLLK